MELWHILHFLNSIFKWFLSIPNPPPPPQVALMSVSLTWGTKKKEKKEKEEVLVYRFPLHPDRARFLPRPEKNPLITCNVKALIKTTTTSEEDAEEETTTDKVISGAVSIHKESGTPCWVWVGFVLFRSLVSLFARQTFSVDATEKPSARTRTYPASREQRMTNILPPWSRTIILPGRARRKAMAAS